MNKNDKLIAIIGVIILVIASIGVYTWKPDEATKNISSMSRWQKYFYNILL